MQVCRFGREFAIARSRSVVKVAMPQRRGNELPISAIRRSVFMHAPRQGLPIVEQGEPPDLRDRPVDGFPNLGGLRRSCTRIRK